MTTSLDAYRSDREQLVARVCELETDREQLVERVRELETRLEEKETIPIKFLRQCPSCGATKRAGTVIEGGGSWLGWTWPQACQGFWRRLFCWRKKPHLHQRCTACGARWVMDAEGWRFG